MPTYDAHEVDEGKHGLGPELYDEVTEDWYSDNDEPSSCRIIASPAHLVCKRQTYPHWEIGSGPGRLRDEVFVELCMSDGSEKLGPTAEANAKTKSNDVDRKKTNNMISSRVLTAAAADDNSDDDDFSAVSAQRAEKAGEGPNNVNDRGAASAVAHGHDQKQKNHLYAPLPNQPSVFTSFVPPHLPPATQFPALDPRVQSFLLSRSQSSSPKPVGQGREEQFPAQEKQRIPLTFSFSRLQMMVADSSSSSDRSSSILQHLAGVRNQVQGSPQSPSLWRLPSDDESGVKSGSSVSRRANSIKDDEDGSEVSYVDEWASVRGEPFSELGAGGHVFDYSFVPDCDSSTFPGSSADNSATYDDSASSTSNYGFASGSEYTCGHVRHYVRTFRNEDGEQGEPFFFRSEPLGRGNNSDRNNKYRGHNSHHQRQTTDTNAAVEDYADCDGSTRANSSASSASLFAIPDSRTSSELYLSPNFPDPDRSNFFASGELLERLNTTEPCSDGTRTEDDNNNHRVYFPTHPVSIHGETKAPATSPGSLSALRKLFSTTRRRVSSAGASALSTLGKNIRRPSSSTSAQTSNVSRPENTRSTPSAKAALEKSERPRVNDRTNAKAKAKAKAGKTGRRVLVKRGRSSTVRPLGARHPEYDHDYGLVRRKSEPSNSFRESEKMRPPGDEAEQTGAGGRDGGKFSFLRRVSQRMHMGHPKVTAKEKLTPSAFESSASVQPSKPISSPQPEILGPFLLQPPPAPPPTPRSEVGQEPKQTPSVNSDSNSRSEPESEREPQNKRRSRTLSGLSVLLRHLSLAGPGNPSANGANGSIRRRRENRSRSRQA